METFTTKSHFLLPGFACSFAMTRGGRMRSQLVFDASSHVPNRFLLCRMLDVWNRDYRRPGPMGSSINEALQALCPEKRLPDDLTPARKPPTRAVAVLRLVPEEKIAS